MINIFNSNGKVRKFKGNTYDNLSITVISLKKNTAYVWKVTRIFQSDIQHTNKSKNTQYSRINIT